MSLLNRISSGLVFEDQFSSDRLNSVWQVSPSDESRYSLRERSGYLRLKHGDPDLYILMNSPRYDYVFEAEFDYNPIRASDQGGLVAFRDTFTKAEMLEYYDPEQGTSRQWGRMRMKRTGDLLEGYGSNDSGKTWELIGASLSSFPKIGMTLKGIPENQSDTLDVNYVRIFRDLNVQIGNVTEGMTVQLLSETGTVIRDAICEPDKDYVKISIADQQMPFRGFIKILDQNLLEIAQSEKYTDIWGGDIFWYGAKLDLEVDGLMMRQDREYQLGHMQSGIIERRVFIVNNNEIPIPNVRVRVAAHSAYYGWEWVDVAEDSYLQPGIYSDTVFIGTIQPGERVPVWLKVRHQPEQQIASLNDYKFSIMIEG